MRTKVQLLTVGLLLLWAVSVRANAYRIMLFSDPHVMDSSLVISEGAAFDEMMDSNRKMLDHSAEAMAALMDTALLYRPDLVLIPGDLTKDGERVSHLWVARQLHRLHAAGIPALVIPGNHDIRSVNARAYDGAQQMTVPNITEAQFDSIYADFGYSAEYKDTASLSYMTYPTDGLAVLAMDATDGPAGTGRLKPQTLQWLLDRADEAHADGRQIIAMLHFQLLNHFNDEGTYISAVRLADADSVMTQLVAHNVRLVLTGHFHVSSVSTDYVGNDSIVEISTGAPITFPNHFRWLTISTERDEVDVVTDSLQTLPSAPMYMAESDTFMRTHITVLVDQLNRKVSQKMDEVMTQYGSQLAVLGKYGDSFIGAIRNTPESKREALAVQYLQPQMVEAYMIMSRGNEWEVNTDALQQEIYQGMDSMIYWMVRDSIQMTVIFGQVIDPLPTLLLALDIVIRPMMEPIMKSVLEDITHYGNAELANRTDDLRPQIGLPAPPIVTAAERAKPLQVDGRTYDVLGRPAPASPSKGIYIQDGKRYLLVQ